METQRVIASPTPPLIWPISRFPSFVVTFGMASLCGRYPNEAL
jgi:hypothetical protein